MTRASLPFYHFSSCFCSRLKNISREFCLIGVKHCLINLCSYNSISFINRTLVFRNILWTRWCHCSGMVIGNMFATNCRPHSVVENLGRLNHFMEIDTDWFVAVLMNKALLTFFYNSISKTWAEHYLVDLSTSWIGRLMTGSVFM